MRNYTKVALAVVGMSTALLAGNALAAAPTTLTGTTVSYSFDADDLGLFGAASVSGDELVFTPFVDLDGKSLFIAQSTNGAPGAAVTTLHITVSANSGYQLSAVNLTEGGAYSLTGGASAFVTGNITALDIEGTNNQLIGNIATTKPTDVIGSATSWIANAGVVLPATGWGGADGVVNSIGLKITNQLYASSMDGGASEVWKNAASLMVVTSPVPEAETYAMMLAGLGLIGFMARRRSLSVI